MEIEPIYQQSTSYEKIQEEAKFFITKHTDAISVAGVALTALGITATSFGSLPLVGGAALSALGIGMIGSVCYRWRNAFTYLVAEPFITPKNHMANHVFTERVCKEDNLVKGRLFYEGDIPVLELNTTDNYEMGYIEGYLLGDKIEGFVEDVFLLMLNTAKTLVGDFSGNQLKEGLERIEIPAQFLDRFQGLYGGIKKYCQERDKKMRISMKHIVFAHVFADIYKSIFCQNIFGIPLLKVMGCSTFVKRENEKMIVARTLDWPAFLKGGENMILRRYQTQNGTSIEMQTLPGLFHALTAKNSNGLITVINELGTVSIGKVPYGLVACEIIESAENVEEGVALMRSKLEASEPASSHILLLADQKTAVAFQVYAKEEENRYVSIVRQLPDGNNQSMWHTNHAIDDQGNPIPNTEADGTTHKRYKEILLKKEETPEEILKSVNVFDTIAAAIYTIEGKDISAKYVHGNYYAAAALSD